jgi:hypothetical protein
LNLALRFIEGFFGRANGLSVVFVSFMPSIIILQAKIQKKCKPRNIFMRIAK